MFVDRGCPSSMVKDYDRFEILDDAALSVEILLLHEPVFFLYEYRAKQWPTQEATCSLNEIE